MLLIWNRQITKQVKLFQFFSFLFLFTGVGDLPISFLNTYSRNGGSFYIELKCESELPFFSKDKKDCSEFEGLISSNHKKKKKC